MNAVPQSERAGDAPAILVVDDSDEMLAAVEALFSGTGVDVVTASSGQAALRALLQRDFAVILLDVGMPGLDGYETARIIRDRTRNATTPIIFVTGHPLQDDVFRAYATGAVDYLIKPVASEVLKSKVAVFVDLYKSAEAMRGQAEALRAANARLRAEAEARVGAERRRELLGTVSALLARREPIDVAFEKLLPLLHVELGWEVLGLWLVDGETLRCEGLWHVPRPELDLFESLSRSVRCAKGEGLPGRVWQSGGVTWLAGGMAEWPGPRRGLAVECGLEVGCGCPIDSERGTIGVVEFYGGGAVAGVGDFVTLVSEVGARLSLFVEATLAHEALRESEERYRNLFESTSDIIFQMDAQGRVEFANAAWTEILGYEVGELEGRTVFELIEPRAREEARGLWQRLMDGEHLADASTVASSKSGRRVHLEGDVFPVIVDGRLKAVRAVLHDVTARKQAEEALAERTRLAMLAADIGSAVTRGGPLPEMLDRCASIMVESLDAAFVRIWTLRPGSSILELQASAGMYTHLDGAHSRVPVGEKKIGLIAEERRPHLTNQVVGDPRVGDQEWARREGMVAFAGYPLTVGDRLVGVLAAFCRHAFSENTIQSIEVVSSAIALGIEAAWTAESLEREMAAAQAATRAKSAFLTAMSHELRTPLNAVIGFAELLADGAPGPINEKQARYVDNIMSSGRHLLGLINDILDLSKVEAGKLELDLETCDPGLLTVESLSFFRAMARRNGIELEVDVEPNLPSLAIDSRKYRQVLYNLLSNAMKFTPEGGTIRVTAGRPEPELFRITVADTGIGIDQADLDRIFEPFEQVRESRRAEHSGTGLGLALTRRLVQLHGGRVWAESPGAGAGSTFTIEIPIAVEGTSSSDGPVVLVVEDDPDMASLLATYLTSEGYGVVHAAAAGEAVSAAVALRPAAITLDILLKDGNGWDVLKELKADPSTSGIPVVVVTALEDQARGVELGAVEFLVKPVSRDRLIRALAAVCPSPASFTVLVVDDDRMTVEYIGKLLDSQGWTVMPAFSGQEAIDNAIASPPDALILDLQMPGVDGFEVARTLRGRPETASIPILVYTAADLSAADRERLEPSISAIAFKAETGPQELVARVRQICGLHLSAEAR